MRTRPNCKINLGLRVLRKRPDGYHDLATVFLPVDLCDEVEIEPLPPTTPAEEDVLFSQSGITVDCSWADNICVKAYRLLKADYPTLPAVKMHLVKNIPFGAGLGGGSADAAFVLRMLNEMFGLGIDSQRLKEYAAKLGADCAFFIDNCAAYATGIGDRLTPLEFDPIADYQLVLAKPDDAVSTREAYGGIRIDPTAAQGPALPQLLQAPIAQWRSTIVNDFEATVFPLHPAIAALKELFYAHGASYAAMSGSGATVFALFPKSSPAPQRLMDKLGATLIYAQ